MDTLLEIMANDMKIESYTNESINSFTYRVCFSALGLWCLKTAQNMQNGIVGSSKNNQTIVLKDMLEQYEMIFPKINNLLRFPGNQNLAIYIRNLYEQTGYLITDSGGRNKVCTFGRSILLGSKCLYFGIPNKEFEMNGLGVFCSPQDKNVEINDFLMRDSLSPEEIFNINFNSCDFYEKDLTSRELQFFDPLARTSPSKAWGDVMTTDCTLARRKDEGSYYRVMRLRGGEILFADEYNQVQFGKFTDFEFRRLYFALKYHYNNPMIMWIKSLDDNYSSIRFSGHLPNREYYFLSLIAWPKDGVSDKSNFIIKNVFLSEVVESVTKIGITVRGEYKYV